MKRGSQQGFLLVVAAILILVAATMAGVIVTLNANSGQGGASHALSTQALFAAESGLEFEHRRLAQNVDWYRATTDPFDSAVGTVGPGTYAVSVNIAATGLRTRMNTVTLTANVFGGGVANRWPASGTLLIDDFSGNPELVTYSATSATTFTITTRNAIVGTVQGSLAVHARADAVYPIATLGVALVANCAIIPSPFTLSNNSKFLDYGTITVFHDGGAGVVAEQLTYSGYTVAGATRTLLGVQRCQNTVTPVAIVASIGDPVSSLVSNAGDANYESVINSIGTVGATQRTEYKIVQR